MKRYIGELKKKTNSNFVFLFKYALLSKEMCYFIWKKYVSDGVKLSMEYVYVLDCHLVVNNKKRCLETLMGRSSPKNKKSN